MAKYPGGNFGGFLHGNPDGFGKYYIHSNKSRQNDLKRKIVNKSK